MDEATKTMIHALAEVILIEKLGQTMLVIGATEKGDTIVQRNPEFPGPTPAEAKWEELQAQFDTGGYTPKEVQP